MKNSTNHLSPSSSVDTKEHAFEIKGAVTTLTVLRLHTVEHEKISQEIFRLISQMPHFFQNAPVVLDCERLESLDTIDFSKIVRKMKEHQLVPVGVKNLDPHFHPGAIEAGLGILKAGMGTTSKIRHDKDQSSSTPTPSTTSKRTDVHPNFSDDAMAQTPLHPMTEVLPISPLLIKNPVRAGQVIYAQQSDLIVLSSVNSGAEVIADGNIHVYGSLRGRALAGAHGNEEARIFCQSLEAELISIAGNYHMAEQIEDSRRGKPSQIFLNDGNLIIQSL